MYKLTVQVTSSNGSSITQPVDDSSSSSEVSLSSAEVQVFSGVQSVSKVAVLIQLLEDSHNFSSSAQTGASSARNLLAPAGFFSEIKVVGSVEDL